MQETVDLLKEFEEINAKFAEPMADDEMNSAARTAGRGAGKTRRARRLGSRFASGDGDGRAALPAARHAGQSPFRRRKTPRRAMPLAACKSPTSCCSTSRPTISTPSQSAGSNSICRIMQARSSPSRTIDIFSTTSPAGFWNSIAGRAFRGKEIIRRGWSRSRNACAGEEKSESERQKTLQRELEWIRMSPKARHAKGKARINAYEALLDQEVEKRREDLEIYIPAGAAARQHRDRSRRRSQRLRRQSAVRGHDVRTAAGRHRRRDRPERRRQNDAVPADHRAGASRRRHDSRSAKRSNSVTSIRAATLDPTEIDLGRDHRRHGLY